MIWPVVGLLAAGFSAWLLYRELRGISLDEIVLSVERIPLSHWFLAGAATLLAYAALAWYDRIALLHLGRYLSWMFVSLASFTSYALSHNIGASVLSGAVIRYRTYSSKGLTAAEVGVLVALCSFTFTLGNVMLGGLILVLKPDILPRFFDVPPGLSVGLGLVMLGLPVFYVIGALFRFRPLSIGGFHLYYPRPPIVARQLLVAPLELIGAAGIIYFALPSAGNPGFVTVLGVFLASFTVALISHAPGGIGVLEYVFVTALDGMDPADVVSALIVFRIFYLLVPLAIALVVVVIFERRQLMGALRRAAE
jgi:uncharacterized membrane protein YbhN (UPF0104 family)